MRAVIPGLVLKRGGEARWGPCGPRLPLWDLTATLHPGKGATKGNAAPVLEIAARRINNPSIGQHVNRALDIRVCYYGTMLPGDIEILPPEAHDSSVPMLFLNSSVNSRCIIRYQISAMLKLTCLTLL